MGRGLRSQGDRRGAADPAGRGHRGHDPRPYRAPDPVRGLAGGPGDGHRGPARAVADQRRPLHRGAGAAARDDRAARGRPRALAARLAPERDAGGGPRGRGGLRGRHGRHPRPRRQARGAGAAGRLPRAQGPDRALRHAPLRPLALPGLDARVAGRARRLDRGRPRRSALRRRLARGDTAALRAVRAHHRARGAGGRDLPGVVADRPRVLRLRGAPGRGRGRPGRARHGERRAGPADRAEAAGDRDPPVGEPGPRLHARPGRADPPVPASRGARPRRRHRGGVAPRGQPGVAGPIRGLPRAARAARRPPRRAHPPRRGRVLRRGRAATRLGDLDRRGQRRPGPRGDAAGGARSAPCSSCRSWPRSR